MKNHGEGIHKPLQYSCLENPIDMSLVGLPMWGHKRVGQDLKRLSNNEEPTLAQVLGKCKVKQWKCKIKKNTVFVFKVTDAHVVNK